MQEQYYIRHTLADVGSSMGFWKIGGGYTTDINQADKFTRNDAISQHQCRAEDQPIMRSLIDGIGYKAVDTQLLGKADDCNPNLGYVIQVCGCYDGNNIKFLSKKGGHTYNYSDAKVVQADFSINENQRLHSKGALDKIARTVISKFAFKIDEAFTKMGIQKRKADRVIKSQKTRGNCLSCGRLVWNDNPYEDPVCKMCD